MKTESEMGGLCEERFGGIGRRMRAKDREVRRRVVQTAVKWGWHWLRLTNGGEFQTRNTFYSCYILPYMDYCSIIWGNAS